jgi:ankyrin repeat protein
LLQNGADANLADDLGQTPLSLAVTLRQKDLAWLLLEHGAEATPGIQ